MLRGPSSDIELHIPSDVFGHISVTVYTNIMPGTTPDSERLIAPVSQVLFTPRHGKQTSDPLAR